MHELLSTGLELPSDVNFERLARSIESAVLAQQLEHASPSDVLEVNPIGVSPAGASARDVDWCFDAPLPLRSGEPREFASATSVDSKSELPETTGTQPSLKGTAELNAQQPDRQTEPSLQDLALAALAAKVAAKQSTSSTTRVNANPPGARGLFESDPGDRISEIKAVRKPPARIAQAPAANVPAGRAPIASVVAIASQRSAQTTNALPREPETSEPALGSALASESAQHAKLNQGVAAEFTQSTHPQRATLLRLLWGGLALAACVTLWVQAHSPSSNQSVASNGAPAAVNLEARTGEAAKVAPKPDALEPSASAGLATAAMGSKAGSADQSAEGMLKAGDLPRASETDSPSAAVARVSANDESRDRAAAESGASQGHARRGFPSASQSGAAELAGSEVARAAPQAADGTFRSDAESPSPARAGGGADPEEAALVPAARAGHLPPQPSSGAATGAIGMVLPAARSCVVGQTEPSRAEVVFGSDGRVRNVTVQGPAAGTSAEACIARVLSGARVRPFSDESFAVRTTVRP
jgi:hypothetical protein